MNILVIGDLHLRGTDIQRQTQMLERILIHARENIYRLIVVLGDTLDRFDLDAQIRAVDFLSELRKYSHVYLLIGNHDRPHNREYLTNRHPFVALKHWNYNITVVDTVLDVYIDSYWFVFVPYVPPGEFSTALGLSNHWTEARCIFAHQEFRGAQDGDHRSVKGDIWSLTNPLVISGHIHQYQLLQPNLLYTGTPIHHHFGENGDRGLTILSVNKNSWHHEQLSLGIPNKIQLELNCDEIVAPPQLTAGTRVKLVGSAVEQRSRVVQEQVRRLTAEGIIITYPTQSVVLTPSCSSFSEALYRRIEDRPRLVELYQRLFGALIK